ncbi:NADH dehydrogenase [ubiquinone] 1 beta subcomplex subunit 7 [Phlebotomus argentipes]|uniref:NADH dehydrogenase [ubiquinone] 1 beta subcomplex subunit 7 n=1 Tax=Phlebotomus argentipes TaxID=94469 RepID=UPI00289379A1|nr:NADH dehydrogenase [ubiquinone] 1 beta subcomplex subunit 7 [Phlebotomus argentipes]
MGNAIGLYITKPDTTPNPNKEPSFDPNLGFSNGRKERVMIATEAEMESAKLPLDGRDYCAHKLLTYSQCRREEWPLVYRCHHERHDYFTCQYEDYILRMKEYEREKRLLERKQRIAKKQGTEFA